MSMLAAVIAETLTSSQKVILLEACLPCTIYTIEARTTDDLSWLAENCLIEGPANIVATSLGRKVNAEVLRAERANPLRWWYSSAEDAETWSPAASREDAIEQANGDQCDPVVIMQARYKSFDLDVIDPEDLLDRFEAHNDECWGEDGPSRKFTPETLKELNAWLRGVIAAWFSSTQPYEPFMLGDYQNQETLAPEDGDG